MLSNSATPLTEEMKQVPADLEQRRAGRKYSCTGIVDLAHGLRLKGKKK
jgi:hypothetical protein